MYPYFETPRPRRTSMNPGFFGDHYSNPSFVDPYDHYYPSYPSPHQLEAERRARAQQLRRQRQERELERQREADFQRRLQHRPAPTDYHDALRAERARRLAQAQAQAQAQAHAQQRTQRHPLAPPPQSAEEPQVQVTLPDGRRCVVPLSWARRMQAKHPDILSDNMITKIRQPSPSPPPENDLVLTQDETDSESNDSAFYTLDRSQEPYPPVLRPSQEEPKPPAPSFPTHRSRDDLDEAARVIQKHIRLYQRIKHLKALQNKFHTLKAEFNEPSLLDLQFSDRPTPTSKPDMPSKLAFNSPINRPLQMFEEMLLKIQIELDGIISGGEEKIKLFRKEVVKQVEAELERIDRIKLEAWKTQCDAVLKSDHKSEKEIPTVEMFDAEAAKSDADHSCQMEQSNAQSEDKASCEVDQDCTMSEPTSQS